MGERGVGRPAWVLSSSTRPPSKPLASSSERSAWGSRAATPRGISSEEMRSRASGTDRGREVSRSRKRRRRSQRSSSPKHSKRERATPILGKTSGMAAVGAWAARYEIANLLTSKCDPNELVRVIHKGEEGRDEILYRGYLLSPSPDRSRREESEKERSHGGSQASGRESRKGPLLESDDGEKSQTSVADILKVPEAAKPETPDEPPWVKRISEKTKGLLGHHQGDASELGLRFAKPAVPPTKNRPETAKETFPEEPPKTAGVAEGERFAKAAKPPKSTQDVRTPGALTVKTVGGTMPRTVKDREARDLAVYQEKSLKIFGTLRLMGIEMDLSDLVLSSDGKVNEDRFSLHTAPNRASTGLRYARLMENLLKWGHEDERPVREGSTPFDRLCTLEFVEHLMQRGCGANTPKAVLLSVDYYGKAFGFESQKGHFGRAKRLSLKCAENPIRGRVGAPLFGNEFINALECLVMDPFLHSPQRIAAGKLRLCIQSSTRYDDILNTPLNQCEWVRKKGELSIIGLRSKALRGKNRARAWIASTLGITQAGDKWLPTLMDLLLKSHKEGWKTDDHLGKLASRDGKFFYDSPARMDADINVLKNVLLENIGHLGGLEVMEDEVVKMRWHGAKATLTTVMQHLNLPPRVVRFAGDWGAAGESMADLYLREAQLLTLAAQQKALMYLRMKYPKPWRIRRTTRRWRCTKSRRSSMTSASRRASQTWS